MNRIDEQIRELTRGTEDVLSEDSLERKLREGRPLNVKFGVDPTAPDIHLGHTVPLQKLRRFQDYGHKVQLVIGDYTAMIGDPSGKSQTRPMLTEAQIKANLDTYTTQVFKVLDRENTELVYNSQWLGEFSGRDLLEVGSRHSVQQLLQRRDFRNRMQSESPLSVTELFYPLLVGYDSVHLKTDVEIGGTDQLFNFMASKAMQKAYGQTPEVVITLPLLEGLDGVQKMSKSLGNAIGVSDDPRDMFGKVMSVSDDLMWKYYELLSDRRVDEIGNMKRSGENPMTYKKQLGHEIVGRYHGNVQADAAQNYFESRHQRKELTTDMEKLYLSGDKTGIIDVLRASGRAKSNGEARRLIDGGAVKIDGERVDSIDYQLPARDGQVLQVGKKFSRTLDYRAE